MTTAGLNTTRYDYSGTDLLMTYFDIYLGRLSFFVVFICNFYSIPHRMYIDMRCIEIFCANLILSTIVFIHTTQPKLSAYG